ncbi:MAG: hypothetical protein Q7T78_11200 [Rhodoferax sp.]|nr:hypothetical protein [Rhodoferax sp.]
MFLIAMAFFWSIAFQGVFMGVLSISGNHIDPQCRFLTYEEHERIAYVTGNGLLASTLADASDLENEVDLFDDILDKAKVESFDSGRYEGIGIDTAKVISDLETELKRLREQYAAIRGDLEAVQSWLVGEACKTVSGRKQCASEIRRRLMTIPRYQGTAI